MKRKKLISIVAAGMVFFLILTLILSLIPATVFAASSSEIQEELNSLESQAQEIQQAKNELAQQQASNASDTRDVVSRKKDIDQEIKLIHDEIDNLNAQIQTYNQLIAEKQKELDDAQARQTELNQQYRVRIRTMEESGKISYWSVLFRANSFTDLLDTINKISEIGSPRPGNAGGAGSGCPGDSNGAGRACPREVRAGCPKNSFGGEPGGVG